MNMRKILMLLALVMFVLLIGCSSDGAEKANSSSDSNEEEIAERLRVAVDVQRAPLDPHMSSSIAMADVIRTMYESLLTINRSNEIVAQVADAYDISEDGKVYTFHLREGVIFHNGKEMKAEDV